MLYPPDRKDGKTDISLSSEEARGSYLHNDGVFAKERLCGRGHRTSHPLLPFKPIMEK